ncbi:MAG: nicotinamidase-related amidase [Candidatus Latescibacterota bacterium]|jgi:nicotinamidase-related amidase
MTFLQLPAHYYKQYDADLTQDIPGRGYDGWTTRMLDVPLERTALVSMHAWNPGLVDEIPAGVDSPYAGWFRFVEYLSRAVPITQNVFPPVLKAARESQMTVIHVGSSEGYMDKFEGYCEAKALAGPPPELPVGAVEDPLRQQWRTERGVQMQGEKNGEEIRAGQKFLDFPPQARPEPGEPVVINSHQLNAVCREKGIWHLVYIGFAINWCLLASPGGMIDMSRMGYVCSTIRQATTAVENKETCSEEWAKEVALWRVALMFGYVFDVDPFVAALQGLPTS